MGINVRKQVLNNKVCLTFCFVNNLFSEIQKMENTLALVKKNEDEGFKGFFHIKCFLQYFLADVQSKAKKRNVDVILDMLRLGKRRDITRCLLASRFLKQII